MEEFLEYGIKFAHFCKLGSLDSYKINLISYEFRQKCWSHIGNPSPHFMASAQTDSTDEISKLFEISWRPDERQFLYQILNRNYRLYCVIYTKQLFKSTDQSLQYNSIDSLETVMSYHHVKDPNQGSRHLKCVVLIHLIYCLHSVVVTGSKFYPTFTVKALRPTNQII